MSGARPARGVTFDFWNTLVAEGASADHRSDRWRAALARAGHEVPQAVLERAMTDLWSWFTARWEGNEVVTPAEAVDRAVELMGVRAGPGLRAEMVDTLHEGTDPAETRIAEGIGEALEALRAAGVGIGIICDVGLTPSSVLRRYLDHHGLLELFGGWSFSDEVGCYKPDRRMFAHAAASLGMSESDPMAHVGDLRRTDVAGARGAGWVSVRYRGFFDDGSDLPDAEVVLADHRELPDALGL